MSASDQHQVQQLQKQQILQQLSQQFGQPQSILQGGNQPQSLVQQQGNQAITASLGSRERPNNLNYHLNQEANAASISVSLKQSTGVAPKRSSDTISANGGQDANDQSHPNKRTKANDGSSTRENEAGTESTDGEKTSSNAPGGVSTKLPANGASKSTPCGIAEQCLPLAKNLINHEHGWVFKDPVDPVELGIPEYFEVVEHPMDLTLVVNKLEGGHYKDIASFASDTKLVFENAILFNGESSDVGAMAKELLDSFARDLKQCHGRCEGASV